VLLLAGISLWKHPKFVKGIAIFGFIVAVADLLFAFVFPTTPLLEWTTVFTALAFVALLSVNVLIKFRKE
jgi:hypothetical protein